MIRSANINDLSDIMLLINQGINYFKKANIDQWQNNYPNELIIKNDIFSKYAYVLEENNQILGYCLISSEKDSNYDNVFDGQWLSNDNYLVIHRLVISNEFKGMNLGSKVIEFTKTLALNMQIYSIKVDTHDDNLSMIKLLTKNNFSYIGIIKIEDQSLRNAYEYVIKK